MLEAFDLWSSRVVLQHNPPPIVAAILRKMLWRQNPGGLAIFQLPTYRRDYNFKISEYPSTPRNDEIEMHVMPVSAVIRLAKEADCDVLEILDDNSAGAGLTSNVFVIGR